MMNLKLNDATALANSLKGLKKPAILLLGFVSFYFTLTKLDDDTTQPDADEECAGSDESHIK